jgi:ribosomal protein L40E
LCSAFRGRVDLYICRRCFVETVAAAISCRHGPGLR